MSDDNAFTSRLTTARDRAVAANQHAARPADKKRAAEQQSAELQRVAVDQWEKRFLPLINGVVETANKHIRGSGTRLRVAEGNYCGSPPCCVEIFGIPESRPDGPTGRGPHAPHVWIGVQPSGKIRLAIIRGVEVNETEFVPSVFNQQQIEHAIAAYVETIVADR